jgi:nucleotide-binding universal stress UspA family protein
MFDTVVVGADESDGAAMAFRRAVEVTKASGGTLHIVNAFSAHRPPAPQLPEEFRYATASMDPVDVLLRDLEAQAQAQSVRVLTHPVLAGVVEAITLVAEREHADLIVVGNGAHHGPLHSVSVPDRLVAKASCAVLVV